MSVKPKEALADLLFESPHFKWEPGMLAYGDEPNRYYRYAHHEIWVDNRGKVYTGACPDDSLRPALWEPSTHGSLLHLVQTLYSAAKAYVKWDALNKDYFVGGIPGVKLFRGMSPGCALARAILEAP